MPNRTLLSALILLVGLASGVSVARADPDYDLYVAEYSKQDILRIDSTGKSTVFASTGLSNPLGLAFDKAGDLYVSNSGNSTIREFSPTGVDLGTFASAGVNRAYQIAFGADGDLYAANDNGRIERFSATGKDLGAFATTGLVHPEGLAFDKDGNLYAANNYGAGANQIYKFSPTGQSLGLFANTGLAGPNTLGFDSAGNLFAVNEKSFAIERFSPTGVDLGAFTSPTAHLITGLAFDPAGNVFSSDFSGGAIHKFSPGGVDLGAFASGLANPSYLAIQVRAVPEPSSLALMGLGLAGLLGVSAGRRGLKGIVRRDPGGLPVDLELRNEPDGALGELSDVS